MDSFTETFSTQSADSSFVDWHCKDRGAPGSVTWCALILVAFNIKIGRLSCILRKKIVWQ